MEPRPNSGNGPVFFYTPQRAADTDTCFSSGTLSGKSACTNCSTSTSSLSRSEWNGAMSSSKQSSLNSRFDSHSSAYAVTVTVTGTAGVKESLLGLGSWIAAAEEVSLQTASEGEKRRCRRDVQRQTVPNTGCGDWKGPVADS